ncbi:MAG: hypothetical protein JJE22_11700 [Bacteroidia bacterium]|nr:hypothetical protein [Bacteroidia bacterium]
MERIEALISKLKEQFEQNAGAAQLIATVQLLHQELAQLQGNRSQSIGTAKVAVVLPFSMNVYSHTSPDHEKYAPQPMEKPSTKEVKETILVDKGSLSLVKENGQLDMVFDPMMEIPTLSHQPKHREINDTPKKEDSLNDKLKQGKIELVEVLKETPVKDLRKAVGINDRFVFINDLFRGDESMYERSIKTINSFNIYPEAEYWISRELKVKLGWDNSHSSVQHFDQLVKRRFS